MLKSIFFVFAIMMGGFFSDPLEAYALKFQRRVHDPVFPQARIVQKQVMFWNQIFRRFPSTTTLIHDSHNPENIVDVIDHKLLAKHNRNGSLSGFVERARLNNLYLERYKLALKRFRNLGKRALKFGGIEKRIFNVYKRKPFELSRLLKGRVSLRSQTGLSDEFVRAAKRAQDYLPYIERAFTSRGVPANISRLAFVESMFNLNAKSKVGASGIWQFMPSTAKMYMKVNRFMDERNSPFKASKGAAKLLAANYRSLKSWPLAITAYNHGRGGISKATKAVGSRDLGAIIKNYKSRTFGFASRNFYAEFIAASQVYDNIVYEKKHIKKMSRPRLTPIVLNKRYSIHQLMKYSPLNSSIIQKHNPCLKDYSFNKGKYHLLPKSFELFVPTTMASRVKKALRRIRPTKTKAVAMGSWNHNNRKRR